MMNKVLILSPHHDVLISVLESLDLIPVLYFNQRLSTLPDSELNACIGVVTSNSYILNAEELALLPNLKFVGRLGSGMEIIDTEYCATHGIQCWSSPMGNANAVAEHALGMLISINNHLRRSHVEMLEGHFLRKENTCHELSRLHVGIVGVGSNGSQFARKLLSLGIRVSGMDIDISKEDVIRHELYTFTNDVLALLSCDVISLHIPLNAATEHFIDKNFIDKMEKSFILINCARGPLVDTHALFEGLNSGKILGAGIDVWEHEPLAKYPIEYKSELNYILDHPSVIATPHIAGYSHEATYKMSLIIAEKIKEWYNISFIQ